MTESNYDDVAAKAAGVQIDEKVIADYWGFDDTTNFFLSDGIQFFVLQRMNEGQKANYQRKIRSDITVVRNTGDAKLKTDPATERHELIKAVVCGWNLYRKNANGKMELVPFALAGGNGSLEKWLSVADPRVVEDLERECRKMNPWLLQDMKPEDIRREINNLEEMYEAAVEREAGE